MKVRNSNGTLLGLSSFQVLAMFRRGLFYTFMSIYLHDYLGLKVTEMTLFATLPMIVNVTFQVGVWGRVSDATQLRRTLIIVAEVVAALGTVVLWWAHTLAGGGRAAGYVLIAGLSVIEVFWSMSNVGWSALISDRYSREERTAVQAQLTSIGAVGRIVGVWIGGVLYDGLGMKYEGWGFREGALFFVSSGAMLISTVPMFFVGEGGIAGHRAHDETRDETRDETTENAQPPAGAAPASPAAPLRGGFVIFLIAMVFINFGRNAVSVIWGPFLALKSGFALSSGSLSHVINARSITMIAGGVFFARRGVRTVASRALVAGTCIAVASLVVLATAHRLWLVYLGSIMAGVSDVMIMASAYALASVLMPPERRGRLFAWYNATSFLSWGLAGTLIAGPVIDSLVAAGAGEVFAYRMSFLSAAGVTLVGLAVLALMMLGRKGGPAAVEVPGAEDD